MAIEQIESTAGADDDRFDVGEQVGLQFCGRFQIESADFLPTSVNPSFIWVGAISSTGTS